MNQNLKTLCCSGCGLMMQNRTEEHGIKCPRCLTSICKKHNKVSYDLSLSIVAMLLFFPAVTLPILSFQLGLDTQIGNMFFALKYFYSGGYWVLSILVFFISIFIPLLYIVTSVLMFGALYEKRRPRFMKLYYKILFDLREWVMLDIYIVSVLVSIVKLENTSDVIFGPGIFVLALLAGVSFLLTNSFTPKQVWRAYNEAN
jgi:paraquat-inducible protein A